MSKVNWSLRGFAGAAAILTVACCGDDSGGVLHPSGVTNRAPEIRSVTWSPEVVPAGGTATITVDAVDPDGDAITCTLLADKGLVTSEAGQCTGTYQNRSGEEGSDRLVVTVTDPFHSPITRSHTIAVSGPQSTDPTRGPRRPPNPAPTPTPDPNNDPIPGPSPSPSPNPLPTPTPGPSPSPSPQPTPNLIPRVTGTVNLDLLPLALGTIHLDVEDDDLTGARCETFVSGAAVNPLAIQAVTCGPIFRVQLQALLASPLGEDVTFRVIDKHGAVGTHTTRVRVLAVLP